MKAERKFLSIQENRYEKWVEVFDTEEEAREHAEISLQYLTKREREQNLVYIADVVREDLADHAFDDEEIDWRCFEMCGHEVYEVINEAKKW